MEYLKGITEGDMNVIDRSLDDNLWAVSYVKDDGPVNYYLYDRAAKQAKFLFTNRKNLEDAKLSKMSPVIIKSRDGLNLVSYLTLPYGSSSGEDYHPSKPCPMVLFVHGGPWARDSWGYNSYHQWLANRGYAVLSVNFRGSTGLGKDFINDANLEWGAKMHDDLIDAVNWAIEEGIAQKDKIAIMGGSYGGYSTLIGLTFTPDVFACGVDIVGPSNLQTLMETIPPYWLPMINMFTIRVGDYRTEAGRKFLESRSPLFFVDKINKPLLIGQGANDPRVKQSEADQIVKAMQEKNIPVTYVLYPDEGHGFARPENRMSFNAVTEIFLSQFLGGRFEPIGNDFEGSSIEVPTGSENIPNLNEALGAVK
jgi:dipeptidyl aminopeptidase/acylaminoacyl peptidase